MNRPPEVRNQQRLIERTCLFLVSSSARSAQKRETRTMTVAHRLCSLSFGPVQGKAGLVEPGVLLHVGPLALRGVDPSSGSQSGIPLNPGYSVLTRGVSRRSGSLAYFREGASANDQHLAECTLQESPARCNFRGAGSRPAAGHSFTAGRTRKVDLPRTTCRTSYLSCPTALFLISHMGSNPIAAERSIHSDR